MQREISSIVFTQPISLPLRPSSRCGVPIAGGRSVDHFKGPSLWLRDDAELTTRLHERGIGTREREKPKQFTTSEAINDRRETFDIVYGKQHEGKATYDHFAGSGTNVGHEEVADLAARIAAKQLREYEARRLSYEAKTVTDTEPMHMGHEQKDGRHGDTFDHFQNGTMVLRPSKEGSAHNPPKDPHPSIYPHGHTANDASDAMTRLRATRAHDLRRDGLSTPSHLLPEDGRPRMIPWQAQPPFTPSRTPPRTPAPRTPPPGLASGALASTPPSRSGLLRSSSGHEMRTSLGLSHSTSSLPRLPGKYGFRSPTSVVSQHGNGCTPSWWGWPTPV